MAAAARDHAVAYRLRQPGMGAKGRMAVAKSHEAGSQKEGGDAVEAWLG
jgi:hypothetical protein